MPPPTWRPGHAFVQRAQGNPLLLRELVQAALQRSALVRRGSVWVLDGQPPLSGGVRDLVAARLAGTGDAERAALETVAAGEPLPIDVAMAMVGEPLLIALEEARLITVRPGLAGTEVATAHPLYGEVLRADLPVLRLRRLRLALAGALETAGQPGPHDLVRAASWRLDSGQGDDPQRLLAAARAARGISLETAERLARHAHETHRSLPATLLLAEILTHTGRGDDAAALLAGLPPDSLRRRTGKPSPTALPSARACSPATRAAARNSWPPWLPGTRRPAGICVRCTPRCSRSTPACRTGSRSGSPSCWTRSCRRRLARLPPSGWSAPSTGSGHAGRRGPRRGDRRRHHHPGGAAGTSLRGGVDRSHLHLCPDRAG